MTSAQELAKKRLLAAALNKLQSLKKTECFDGNDVESRPTDEQLSVIDAVRKQEASVISVRAGNQCLAKGTLVLTPAGAVPIEDIRVGDTVYSEHGTPIKVLKVFANGVKSVYTLRDELDIELCRATENHVFLCEDGKQRAVKDIGRNRLVFVHPEFELRSLSYVSVSSYPEQEETYDIHVDSETNLYLLANGLVTHNSGKSQTAARIFAWLLEGTFPDWKQPPKWGSQLQLLVLGRSFKQLEDSLWRKMEALLTPGTYKVVRIGGALSKVVHDNGNSVLFFSHDNVNLARERVQSFSAEAVWLDELPRSVKLIEELQRRVQAKDGFVLMTYTPKAPAPDIKRFVETMRPPVGIEYRLTAFANPVYSEADKKKLVDSLSSFSEAYRATILQGEWLQPEEMVYQFDYDRMVANPPDYSPAWRHVASVDPASSGLTGLCVAAESPSTGWWYLIRAEYLNVKVPTELVETIEERLRGVNVVRRIYDPHETWFQATAAKAGFNYVAPYKKHERKKELIKGLQQALGTRLFVTPWCQDFVDEVTSCHYSDELSDRIAKSSRFHVLDSAQYLVDLLPAYEHGKPQQDWYTELRLGNEKRKRREQNERQSASKPYAPRNLRVRRRPW